MKSFLKKNKRYIIFTIFYITIFMVISTIMVVFLTRPDGEVSVPHLRGEKFIDVYNSLIRHDLKPVVKFYETSDVESGVILEQYPVGGTVIYKGTRIKIVVSRNNLKVKVPSLEGSELPIAINKLKNMHVGDKTISVGTGVISYISSDKTPNNIVILQSPKAGEKMSPEEKINLLVSAGNIENDNRMPSLIGQSIDLIYELLLSKGVTIYEKTEPVGKNNVGKIISQKPYRNAKLKPGDSVTLTIGFKKSDSRYYSGYEKYSYTVPDNEGAGLYEVYIDDQYSKRLRFSRNLKPGDNINLVFHRTGNAKVYILKDKKQVKLDSLKVEEFL